MPHVFISYLREDSNSIDRLSKDLKASGVGVWVDRDQIRPGEHWKTAIRLAMEDGAFFLACFSQHYGQRTSYMDEEVDFALTQMEYRSDEWLIPVKLSKSGAYMDTARGKRLKDIQWVDLSNDWDAGVQKLLEIVLPRAKVITRQVLDMLERHARKKLLEQRARVAVLKKLTSSSAKAVPLTCRSLSKEWKLQLRPSVTLGELSTAIAREYYRDDFDTNEFYFRDADRSAYDPSTTAAELQSHSIEVVLLYTRPRGGGLPAAAIPPRLWILHHELRRLTGLSHAVKWNRARIYLWFYKLQGADRFQAPRWLINHVNELAFLYSEANIHIDRAMQLAELLEKSELAVDWVYRDTIAWVYYRAKLFRTAFRLLALDLPDAGLRDVGVMYHLYFICRQVGDDQTAKVIRDWFSQRFPELDWKNAVPPRTEDGVTVNLFSHQLECERVLLNEDSHMV